MNIINFKTAPIILIHPVFTKKTCSLWDRTEHPIQITKARNLPSSSWLSIRIFSSESNYQGFHFSSFAKFMLIYSSKFLEFLAGAVDIFSLPYATVILTYLLIPWSRVLLEKLTGSNLIKKFPSFYGSRGSLLHLQVPVTCPYPEPDRSSPCLHIPFP